MTYYGDFEAYSKEICKRVGSSEKEFICKLKKSAKLMKKSVKEINFTGLFVDELASKKWNTLCKKNENYKSKNKFR